MLAIFLAKQFIPYAITLGPFIQQFLRAALRGFTNNMASIDEAAKKTYEVVNQQTCIRVPWNDLSEYWKDYWRSVVKTALEASKV
jgi:hypothetical protein